MNATLSPDGELSSTFTRLRRLFGLLPGAGKTSAPRF